MHEILERFLWGLRLLLIGVPKPKGSEAMNLAQALAMRYAGFVGDVYYLCDGEYRLIGHWELIDPPPRHRDGKPDRAALLYFADGTSVPVSLSERCYAMPPKRTPPPPPPHPPPDDDPGYTALSDDYSRISKYRGRS